MSRAVGGTGASRLCALVLGAVLCAACGDDDSGDGARVGRPDAALAADGAAPVADDDAGGGAADAADALVADDLVCAACDGSCEQALELEPAQHLDGPIDYADHPPAGGPHSSCWANYTAYLDAPLPPEQWVHNLEHGGVVFLYHCPDGCAAEKGQLVALGLALPRVVVTEYPDMPAGFAAVSWGHRLVSSCFDAQALQAFHEAHFDRAPESVSSGAPDGC